MTDAATIEAALARAGWVAGAEALVAGWVDHRQSELTWEETWKPDDRCRYIGTRPTGEQFVVTYSSGDHWEFSITWPDGWGSEHVRMGFVEDLQEEAWELDQAEGPFGGPTRRNVPMCSLPGQRGRRLAGDVELRFEQLREDLAAYFFITREGRLNNLWIVALNPNDLPAALDSLERTPRCAPSLWAQVQGKRRAWSFTAWRPVLARMRVAEYELLLVCPDPSTAVILAHVAGRLHAAVQFAMSALPDLEVGRWLTYARPWPRNPVGSGDAPPSTSTPPHPGAAAPQALEPAAPPAVSAASPSRPPPPADAPANDAATTVEGRAVVEPPADVHAEKAPLQPASPAPEGQEVSPSEPAPAEQPKPRFSLAADASPEEIERHFSEVGAAIPPPRVSDGSLLFLMHLLSKMQPAKDGGSRFGIVLNGSPLFTGGAGSGESEIRRYVLESDLVEAIIALPTDMFYNTGISTYVWIVSNRKPAARKGKVQLIDASGFWQKMRKTLGSKRKELSGDHIDEITRLFGKFRKVTTKDGVPISRIFKNEDFGYRTITVERPTRDEKGKVVLGTKGKGKGKPVPDASLRDTENVPLREDVEAYFEREVLPHAPDAWIDHEKTKVGYEIPFNRHFYVFKPPRALSEIDADLKVVTDRILEMIGGLSS